MNRMKSNQARGRSIANDSSVQTLFLTINQMHPQLLKYVNEQDEARGRKTEIHVVHFFSLFCLQAFKISFSGSDNTMISLEAGALTGKLWGVY